ncbi:MAG: hypothetical protein Q8P18_15105 [Pseudomonadota bacterium]|nr:hypothetical protein [Pseudomonadota bacterium]
MAPGRKRKGSSAASSPSGAARGSSGASSAKSAPARQAAAAKPAKPAAVAKPTASKKAVTGPADALAPFRAQLGNAPDADVAARAGVSVDEVKAYRRERQIPAYRSAPPARTGAVAVGAPVAPRAKASDSDSVVRRRRTTDEGMKEVVVRTPAAEPVVVSAPVVADASNPLESFRDQLGKVADHVIALQANVDRTVVGAWRRKLGVPAYDGFRKRKSGDEAPPVATKAAAPKAAPKAAPEAPSKLVVTPEPGIAPLQPVEPAKPAVTKAAAPSRAEAPAAKGKPGRRSAIDAFFSLVGKQTDAEVAAKANVSVAAVTQYRIRRGIPAAGRVPSAAKAAASSPSKAVAKAAVSPSAAQSSSKDVRHRRSKLDAHAHLVGKLSDAEVALLANVSSEGVRQYRRRHGIIAAGSRAPGDESAPVTSAVAAPIAVVAPVAPVARVAPAAVVAPAASAASSSVAYSVIAHHGDESRRFVAIGVDIRDALTRGMSSLDARADGPWVIQSVRRLCDALS